jgi:hypothetical protein
LIEKYFILDIDKKILYLHKLKNMSKFNTTTTREIIDCETGEVKTIDVTKTFTTKVTSDSFYMTFIDYISPIYKLKSDAAKTVLTWLCHHADFNTGIVSISSKDRKEMCSELNITNSTVSNNLKKLKELNLISGEGGKYMINPQVFWKGELKERNKLLNDKEIQITFSI